MKAILVREFGGPEVLEYAEVERPTPGEGEVLVEVRAAGVNYADAMRRRNRYLALQSLPFIPGSEVAGVVAETGPAVGDVSVGDRVAALVGEGGYAEYALAPARGLIPVPEGLGFDEAAAIPLQGLTAYLVLRDSARLAEGESVLVHAAAGGVGYLAVQMARLLGAGTVVATASTGEKLEVARSLGADVLVDYTEEGWPERVREATGGRGVDVILEMVGGDFPRQNLRCLAPGGRMVVYGSASGERSEVPLFELMRGQQTVSGFWLARYLSEPRLRGRIGEALREILSWLSAGELRLNIGGRYPLSEAARAHADLEGRRTTGKLLLMP
ncbi:NADPH:quinone reductase [Rubrobacter xylanophilus]|uniref:NADPH:quinone reductase n=1 Tax=Rubrobacter xylanophilus TaxID=49319 RepID=A0A510HIK4_9ACTN|nr:quinone oxidoreductase [Rubrobacter xylanophilus]BBL79748.1 NADPH:quinone reductase [Rubrobacter xylanophilus]